MQSSNWIILYVFKWREGKRSSHKRKMKGVEEGRGREVGKEGKGKRKGEKRGGEDKTEEGWEGLSSNKYAKFIDCEYLLWKSILRKSHLILNKTTCIHFTSTEMSFVIINIKQ